MNPFRGQGLHVRRSVQAAQDLLGRGDRERLTDEPEDPPAVGDLHSQAPLDLAQVSVEEPAQVGQAGVVLREQLDVQGMRVGGQAGLRGAQAVQAMGAET